MERAKIEEERKKGQKKDLSKVPQEQRGWFEQLMELAQKSDIFSEEHDHYLDLYTHSVMWRSALGLGRRFVQVGAMDDPEDIFFLIPDEVRRAGINPDQFNLRPIVDRRKSEWEEWKKNSNPPDMLEEGRDWALSDEEVIEIRSIAENERIPLESYMAAEKVKENRFERLPGRKGFSDGDNSGE
jgi:pyruvate, water dikinase